MEILAEEWRDVIGYEGEYRVSDFGRIKSVTRLVPNGGGHRLVRERIRPPYLNKVVGYFYVQLWSGNKTRLFRLHRIVAEAFIGHPPSGTVVNHKDGDKSNNRADNLEYVTQKENIRHAISTGLTRQQGELSVNAKLTDKDALEAYTMYANGALMTDVASRFGVSKSLIGRIVIGKHRRHLCLPAIHRNKTRTGQ